LGSAGVPDELVDPSAPLELEDPPAPLELEDPLDVLDVLAPLVDPDDDDVDVSPSDEQALDKLAPMRKRKKRILRSLRLVIRNIPLCCAGLPGAPPCPRAHARPPSRGGEAT